MLLKISGITRALIGQFSGPYSTVGQLKFKVFFFVVVAKMFRDLLSSVFNCLTSKSLNVLLLVKLCIKTC